MISQDRIPHTDVPSNPFIESSFSKHSVSCSEMLLPVQPLFFQGIELRIRSHFQSFASLVPPKGADTSIAVVLAIESRRNRCHNGVCKWSSFPLGANGTSRCCRKAWSIRNVPVVWRTCPAPRARQRWGSSHLFKNEYHLPKTGTRAQQHSQLHFQNFNTFRCVAQ